MSNLKIPPEKAIDLLNGRLAEMQGMVKNAGSPGYYDFLGWCSKTYSVIDEIYPADDFHPEEIRNIGLPTCSCSSENVTSMLMEVYHSRLRDYIDEIQRSMKGPE